MADRHQRSRVVDQPQPGFFTTRIVKRGPKVAARIYQWDDGTWTLEIDGEQVGMSVTDPHHHYRLVDIANYADFSDESEYQHLLDAKEHALRYAPDSPAANPRVPLSTRNKKLEF